MVNSLQDFKSSLGNQKQAPNNAAATSAGAAPAPQGDPSTLPSTSPVPPSSRPDDAQLQEAAQQRRDKARQAAVYTAELKQPQKLFDTYTNAASQADSSSSSSSSSSAINKDPVDMYQASLKYSRRQDLMAAFEKAKQPETPGAGINISV
jgi:hypothetical protein